MWVKVTGLQSAIDFNKKIANNPKMQNMMKRIVDDTVAEIRRNAPVDTGNLINSVYAEKKGKGEYSIVVDVPYAIFLEYGTRYIDIGTIRSPKSVISKSGKASYRPFMRPAIWKMNQSFPQYVKRILFNWIT
jgi:HK97 gp10 family phage protein